MTVAGPSLFDPVALGPVTAPNRVFFAPTSVGYASSGVVTDALTEHYGRRAQGGAGAVMTEHFAVSEEGWQHRGQPGVWPDPSLWPGLQRLAAEIRGHGALAIAQISHAGRYAGPWSEWAAKPRWAPSPVPFPLLGETVTPREMSTDHIAAVVRAFGEATRRLVAAGWQGVEIHAGTGFLVSGFLSPRTNHRTDGYGGDAAGRVRFAQEIVAACRDAARGEAAVGIHLLTDELTAGGIEAADIPGNVAALEAAGVEFLRANAGSLDTLGLPENRARAAATDANRRDTDLVVAAATVPVLAGGGLRTRADAEAALAGGAAAVALARPMLADPDWGRKVAAGADDEVVGCSCAPPLCLQTQLSGAVCAAWPSDVRERGHCGYGDRQPGCRPAA